MSYSEQEIRAHFVGLDAEIPTLGGSKKSINFDNAATTPPFRGVIDTLVEYMPWYASVHRSVGLKSRLSTDAYETARHIVGQFVGADLKRHTVIFGKNATEAINKAASRIPLKKSDVVLISSLEHHSNDLPWRTRATVVRIGLDASGGIDRDHYQHLLARYSSRIRLVAISGASNVTGHLPDIHWFAKKAHEVGAQILVDAAQLAAHRPIHMGSLDEDDHLDYVAISAHKMYAPFGAGALIGRTDTFEHGIPDYKGGGTVKLVTATRVDWADLPDREEAGSPNVTGAIAMARAIQTLKQLGFETIAKHEAELAAYALRKLQTIPGLTLYGETDPRQATQRLGIIPFSIKGVPHGLVAAILSYEWGIGVRNGCFCAHPYVTELLKIDPTLRKVRRDLSHGRRDHLPGLVRISFGVYNSKDEIDVLIRGLQAIVRGEHVKYRQHIRSGEFHPVGATLDAAACFSL